MTARQITALAARALALAAIAAAGAAGASAGEAPSRGFGAADFYWKLALERKEGKTPRARGTLLELLPGSEGRRRLLVRLGARRAAMLLAAGGRETELASARLTALPGTVTLVRRGGVHYLLADGRCLLRARHSGAHRGRPGARLPGGAVSLREVLRQKTGALFFSDGFSRAAGKPGPWRVRSGLWESAVHSFAAHSANPGAVRARFDPRLPADPLTAGRLRSARQGLGVNLAPLEGGALAVTRVTGSSPAEKAGLGAGDVILAMDGRPLSVKSRLIMLAGREVELTVLGAGGRKTHTVRLTPGAVTWGQTSRAAALPGARTGDVALATVGESYWGPYRLECSARTRGGAALGLAFALSAKGGGLLFRLRPARSGWRAELVRLGADGRALAGPLASGKIGAPWPDSWYRLAVDVSDDGKGAPFLVRCLLGDVELLRARSAGAGFGRAGLWSAGRAGQAEFDDLIAASDRAELARRRRVPASFWAAAAADPFMAGWSMPASDWLPAAGGARYRFPCYSGARVRLAKLPAAGPVEITWAGPGGKAACSVRLDAAAGRAELLAGGKLLRRAALPAARPVEAGLARGALSVRAGGKVLLSAKVGAASRPALSVRPARLAAGGALAVCSAEGVELGFDRAPVELVTSAGVWGVANRWICDPRWSWFAGRARPLSAAWTARRFDGDQRLDLFAAPMMIRLRPPLESPRDFGLTLCGDGRSLWSGYTLVFGADNNRSTRLYRKGALVAETRAQRARFPNDFFSKPSRSALHMHWYRLALERRGDRVIFSVGGRAQLSWTDPEPLAGGRAAVWAMRGGVLVARLRLDAERVGKLEPDLGAAAQVDLAGPLAPANPFEPPPAVSRLEGGVWRVAAPTAGGPPAVRVRALDIDPAAGGILKFRFRAAPGTAVDLYLESDQVRYRLGLTGPRPDPRAEEREVNWLGAAPGVAADGEWRELSLNLGAYWRDFWRARRPAHAAPRGAGYRLVFGCLGEAGYLAAGLGGNPAGAWYELSAPEYVKPERDLAPPRPGKLRLAGNTPAERARLVVPLADPGGSGLDTRKLTMLLGARGLKVGSPGVSCSELAGRLVIDIGAVGARPGPAGEYQLVLKGIADLAGNRLVDQELSVNLEAGDDHRPPEAVAVSVKVGGAEVPLDLGPGRFRVGGGYRQCFLRRHYPERAGDPAGCELVNLTDGGYFSAFVLRPGGTFDLARFPELDMACRFGPTTPLAAVFRAGSRWAVAAINEARVQPGGRAAWCPPRPLEADRTWQRLSLPLAAIYRQNYPANPRRPTTSSLRLGDTGERRARLGAHLAVGGLRLVPAVNPAGLVFSWTAWDALGVAEYRSAVDNSPKTSPGERGVENGRPLPAKACAALKEGSAWLHLAFKDKAGNWSRPAHYRFIVDRSPPKVVRTDAAGGALPRADGFDVYLSDRTGVDPASLLLKVNGAEYKLGKSRGLSFDAAGGRLRWDARLARGRTLSVDEKLAVELSPADFAGNRAAKPLTWAWQVKLDGDRRPPSAPRVRFTARGGPRPPGRWRGSRVFHSGRISPIRNARLEVSDRDGGTVRLVRKPGPGAMAASLTERPWRLGYRPGLLFEYRASRGMRLELLLLVSGHELVVPLTGLPGAPAVADGAWHQAVLDLAAPAREKLGELPAYCVGQVIVREAAGKPNPPGSFLELRRAELWTGRTLGTGFILESVEAGSGLAGFSVVLDQKADTMPPESLSLPVGSCGAAGRRSPGGLGPGAWWLHGRARDLAGNWSGPTHYRLVVPASKVGRKE